MAHNLLVHHITRLWSLSPLIGVSPPAAVVLIEINVNDIISWVKDSPFAVNIRVVTITYYTIVGSLNTIEKCSLYTILPMIEEMEEILRFKHWDTTQCHRILFLYSSCISGFSVMILGYIWDLQKHRTLGFKCTALYSIITQ